MNTNERINRDICPKLTIGMPVFNCEKYLEGAIESLLQQDFKDFVLLISDNASTDKTQEICRRCELKDPRITYYRQNNNIGAQANFRFVLDKAITPYFMWAAHDDRWAPTFASKLITLLEQSKDLVLAFCNYERFNHITHNRLPRPVPPVNYTYSQLKNFELLIRQPTPSMIYGIFRTGILKKVIFGVYDFFDVVALFQVATFGNLHRVDEVLFTSGVTELQRSLKTRLKRKYFCFKVQYLPFWYYGTKVILFRNYAPIASRLRLALLFQKTVYKIFSNYEKDFILVRFFREIRGLLNRALVLLR